jgi:hypothetical protein
VLPGRIDVGRHYIRYGGVAALREKYEQIVSRVQSFGMLVCMHVCVRMRLSYI